MKDALLNSAAYLNLFLTAIVLFAAITGGTMPSGALLILFLLLAFTASGSGIVCYGGGRRRRDRASLAVTTAVVLVLPWIVGVGRSDWWETAEVVRFYVAPWAALLSVAVSILLLTFVRRTGRPSLGVPEMLARAIGFFVIGILTYLTRRLWPQPVEQWVVNWFALTVPVCFLIAAAFVPLGTVRQLQTEPDRSTSQELDGS